MSERERQNRNHPTDQQDGYRDQIRQPSQWQADTPRQPSGNWQSEPGHGGYHDYSLENERARGADTRALDEEKRPTSYFAEERVLYGRSRRPSPERARNVIPKDYYEPGYSRDFSSFNSEDYGGRDLYARGQGIAGGYAPSETYRPSYGPDWGESGRAASYGRREDRNRDRRAYDDWRSYGENRGWFDRASDEVASWFGNEEAARRREMDHAEDHRGRGPSNYTRSDERIREDVNDALTHERRLDATHVSVNVTGSEVTLDGSVDSREAKRRAEDAAHDVSGVKHVQNNLRVESTRTRSALAATPAGEGKSSI